MIRHCQILRNETITTANGIAIDLRVRTWFCVAAFCFIAANDERSFGTDRFDNATITNVIPRQDIAGEIIDAHDGCLQFFDGCYYLYGTAYGNSSGFSINNRFRVYSSPDLMRWTFQGELLKEPSDGVYYRPYVVFNPSTHKYVLFYNRYPKLWDGRLGVATSETPVGPFTIANPDVQVSQAKFQPGDGSPFVDDDGTAYFIYTVIAQDHAIRVEQLTADYLTSTGKTSGVLARGSEAPVMFRRNGIYYALFDKCCCFCPGGSGREYLLRLRRWVHLPNGPTSIDRMAAERQLFMRSKPGWHKSRPPTARRSFGWQTAGALGRMMSKGMIFSFGVRPCGSIRRETFCRWKTVPSGKPP